MRDDRMFGALLVETIPAQTAPAVQQALGERGLVVPAADGPEALLLEAGGGRVAGFSTISPDKPEDNQDAGLVVELDADTTLLAVADGAGGIRGGRRASRIALSTLRDTVLYADREASSLRDIMVSAFEKANLSVIQATRGAATTLTAVLIEGRVAQIFHVGDSIGLVTGQRSRVDQNPANRDHNPLTELEKYFVEQMNAARTEAERQDVLRLIETLSNTFTPEQKTALLHTPRAFAHEA